MSLELTGVDLDDFLCDLECVAESAQNEFVMQRLAEVSARIEAGLAGDADPGWHMLRPALARLDVSRKQGQYLAFIQLYTRLHRQAPAEADIREYFRTTSPTVHEMPKTLVHKKFISQESGVARSITVLLAPHEIPELE